VWSAVYDSFGNCQVDASSTITNNLHGPGQYHDAETGLYYNLNRYYDPATGRYLSTDPIEDGLNLYAYCFNDPVNLMDPEGLCAIKWMRNQIHEILAAAGMIPVLGAVPDLLDSLIYAAEGDFYQAAFAIGCAVPGAGDALRGLQFASKGLKYADKSGALNTFKKLIMNNRGAIGDAKNITKSGIKTPYGIVKQSNNPAALAARTQVEEGATLYRLGTTGKSEAAEAQFWALEHPNTPGFAQRYGIPAKNIKNANFIEAAKVNPGTPFVTRPAPGIGSNTGGGIEVIVPEGGVHIEWFKH
jgi:RHS repeat-associated protein